MAARFFSGKNIRIERGSYGVLLNITTPDGTLHEDVEARRYFPISNADRYITIVKLTREEGKDKDKIEERFIIKDTAALDEDSRAVLESALEKYYMIPKILDIKSSKMEFGTLRWKVETDRGMLTFDIRDVYSSIKQLPDGRILVIDSYDNRYEITDYEKLSSHGQKLLLSYL